MGVCGGLSCSKKSSQSKGVLDKHGRYCRLRANDKDRTGQNEMIMEIIGTRFV
jgi:hypothetical protein